MRCATAREQLFAAERPGLPGQALAEHLAGCRACRAAQRRLERLERDLPLLPVPPCPPPAALFEQVLHGPGDVVRLPDRTLLGPDRRQGGRQKLALAFALAASLAVFAISWGAWPRQQDPPRAVSARQRYEGRVNQRLAGAPPQQGVVRLTEMAEELLAAAQKADAARLEGLAREVEWLASGELPYVASRVPPGERAKVLAEVAARLQRLDSEAARLQAARAADRAAAPSLERIARAVSYADRRLRQMAEERG